MLFTLANIEMVRVARFELAISCSQSRRNNQTILHSENLERGMRIELTASAWKAEVLPLYEPRMIVSTKYNLQSQYYQGIW